MSVAPERPKGPPLNAMRAFEAAARLESFVAAADELSVTPGAVSQHIKALEAWADTSLFQRNAQGVELTSAGRQLLPDFVGAFDALGAATHALRNLRTTTEIHIAALPSVAQLWLPARLGRVRQDMTGMRFSVTALESPPNLARELFDMSLLFQVPTDDPNQLPIAPDEIFPVCSPRLANEIRSPEQLNDVPLLIDQTWKDDWEIWARSAGLALNDPQVGPRYSLYSLAVEEAKSGAGVLMGHACLVSDALADGSLARVLDHSCMTDRSLVVSLPDRRRRNAMTDEFVRLLTG